MTPNANGEKRLTTAGGSTIGIRKRPDLVIVPVRHKHAATVVVKDPLAMAYHRLRPDELFVLECLEPGATLQSLRDQYERRFSPEKVSRSQLNELLFRFHRLGLTVSDAPDQGRELFEKRRQTRKRRWAGRLSSVLFIRFPGVDPEPLLRRLYPRLRPLLSGPGMLLITILCITAAFVLASHGSRLTSEFPDMQQWLQLRAVLILAAVIGGTKILHELGHALVCKHFGGECHEIGPMLLVFTPALFCDTSDSWTLPNRFHRAAVGLAGIGTEILLAAIATLVWAATGPTLIHYIAMNVMLVCSVSTVLFNANPLLRYDGYYVLSDLVDVPNLGQKSTNLLAKTSARLLLGVTQHDDEPVSSKERVWLLAYATAAVVYRWAITLLILWVILLMLRPYRLESLGRIICTTAALGLLYATLRGPLSFLRHPGQRRLIRMNRMLVTGTIALLLITAAGIPLPSGESATGRIVPRVEVPVFVATGGHLDKTPTAIGTVVRQDDPLAELVNPDVVQQYSTAQARVESQRELVRALKSGRSMVDEVANELPVAEAMLEEYQRQLETRRLRREALTIRAPTPGRLIAPPQHHLDQTADELTLTSWTGDPTAARNRGCLVEPGTELFTIVSDDRWDAELIVSADQTQRIDVGNRVKLILESAPSKPIIGVVSEISSKQWNAAENRERRDDDNAVHHDVPLVTAYAVRVQLEASDTDSTVGLIPGAEVSARISAAPISIWGRLIRFTSRLVRFR